MIRVSLVLALSIVCPGAMAADQPAGGDPEKGKARATACAACHGPDGNSSNPQWPKLAGQHEKYLYQQLLAYKNGERQDAIMAGQVAALSEEDMRHLAAYYADQSIEPGVANPELVERAEGLHRGGRSEDGIPACSGCHGPQGLGNAAAAYPRISGQHAEYTATQLEAFREGSRAGTAAAQMMSNVVSKLSDADIRALASYLSGLH